MNNLLVEKFFGAPIGRSVTFSQDGLALVTVTPPPSTGFNPSTVVLTMSQFSRYEKWVSGGGLIQELLGDLSIETRETLKTGISSEEWNEAFQDE